jgi:hypothetical protein
MLKVKLNNQALAAVSLPAPKPAAGVGGQGDGAMRALWGVCKMKYRQVTHPTVLD